MLTVRKEKKLKRKRRIVWEVRSELAWYDVVMRAWRGHSFSKRTSISMLCSAAEEQVDHYVSSYINSFSRDDLFDVSALDTCIESHYITFVN